MDRLSAYAARESEAETAEEKVKNEEEATTKLFERLRIQKEEKEAKSAAAEQTNGEAADGESHEEAAPESAAPESGAPESAISDTDAPAATDGTSEINGTASKRRNIPENVKLFEIFHEQVISLVKMQRLPIQDITALLVSLANLALWVA